MNRLLVLMLLGACGSSSITSPNTDAPIASNIDAPPAGPCTRASQCPPGNLCNPADGMCVPSLPCTTHSDCGGEAYCPPGGMCAPSQPHGPCDTDLNCIGQEGCDLDTHICGCGGALLTTTIVAPNMLVTLDRSNSMETNTVPGTGTPLLSRWVVAKRTIVNLTAAYEDRIRFGLLLWPGPNQGCTGGTSCMGSDYGVAIAPMTAGEVSTYLGGADTCNLMTPIGHTLDGLVSFADLGDATRPNYVVLMTDGDENCDGDGAAAATALRGRTPEVKTFVIGFSGDVNGTELTDIARAGGTARSGTPEYYRAETEGELQDAFNEIAGAIATCSFTLSEIPADSDRLFVYIGGTQIPRDTSHTNGWDYDATSMQLTFYGTNCTAIRGGTAGALAVSYGCPIIGKPTLP